MRVCLRGSDDLVITRPFPPSALDFRNCRTCYFAIAIVTSGYVPLADRSSCSARMINMDDYDGIDDGVEQRRRVDADFSLLLRNTHMPRTHARTHARMRACVANNV